MEEPCGIGYVLNGGSRACIHPELFRQPPYTGSVSLGVGIEESVTAGLCVVHDGAFSVTGLIKVCAVGQSLRIVLFYSLSSILCIVNNYSLDSC